MLLFSCIINLLGQTKDVNADYICIKGKNYTEKEHNVLRQKDKRLRKKINKLDNEELILDKIVLLDNL